MTGLNTNYDGLTRGVTHETPVTESCDGMPSFRPCCSGRMPREEHTESPRLHFMTPPTGTTGRVELAASSAQLDLIAPLGLSSAEVESLLQLRGSVEVMMCSPDGCSHGSMVLRADAVDSTKRP